MIVVLILVLCLLILGIIENLNLKKNIENTTLRILVNGTRGKSSTVRLLVAALNNCGIKTIGKSTGSEAFFILEDGNQIQINRRFGTNMVREQKKLFSLASSRSCKAIVCECQAVREESQIMYRDKLFCPTLVAITNIRADHQDLMGDRPQEIIYKCVPQGVDVVTASGVFTGDTSGFKFKAHPQNIELALSVCSKIGLDRNKALEGMKNAKGDIGHIASINAFDKTFINGFAVNDAPSAKELFKGDCSVVFANRKDREYRISEFKKMFEELEIKDIKVIGDNRQKCARLLGGKAFKSSEFYSLVSSCKNTVVCCGNIVGSGRAFIEYLLGENR